MARWSENAFITRRPLLVLAGLTGLLGWGSFRLISGWQEREQPAIAESLPPESLPQESCDKSGSCQTCTLNLSYDPQALGCAIKQDSAHIWAQTPRWQAARQFRDRKAVWLAPGAARKRPDGALFCPEIEGTQRLMFWRHFALSRVASVRLEVMNDEGGALHIWRESDTGWRDIQTFSLDDNRLYKSFPLRAGRYVMVVDAVDEGASTALLLSLKDDSGKVLLRTSPDAGWCALRATSSDDPKDLITKGSACWACGKSQG